MPDTAAVKPINKNTVASPGPKKIAGSRTLRRTAPARMSPLLAPPILTRQSGTIASTDCHKHGRQQGCVEDVIRPLSCLLSVSLVKSARGVIRTRSHIRVAP